MEWDGADYGERIASIYDDLYEEAFDRVGAVEFLAEKAGSGPALELAIGTGRIGLPLANQGVEVTGIDISEAMVARLRDKPGGAAISVAMGDFADVGVTGEFPLIYLVFNTIFALTTQEDQLRCFKNAAEHLADQGVFVIEAFVPDVTRFQRHQNTEVNEIERDRAMLSLSRHDPAAQTISSQHIIISDEGVKTFPIFLRYIWPPEMDLMARLAGLELRERYGSWRREPFSSASTAHVSVYGLA